MIQYKKRASEYIRMPSFYIGLRSIGKRINKVYCLFIYKYVFIYVLKHGPTVRHNKELSALIHVIGAESSFCMKRRFPEPLILPGGTSAGFSGDGLRFNENLYKSFKIYKNYLYNAYANLYSIYFIYTSFDV